MHGLDNELCLLEHTWKVLFQLGKGVVEFALIVDVGRVNRRTVGGVEMSTRGRYVR